MASNQSRDLAPGDEGTPLQNQWRMDSEGNKGRVAGEVDLFEITRMLWASRWLVLGVAMLFAGFGAGYAWLATPWYRAEVVLIPAEDRTNQGLAARLGQFGGLASLAGISLGSSDKTEPLAILKSRDFAASFIEQRQLLTVLFADQWDPVAQKWRTPGKRVPDIRDAVQFFDKRVRRIQEDRKTGLVTLVIEWTDADLAATWANELADQINRQARERALEAASSNITYLQSEMKATSIVSLQQAIGRLLESEMQQLMLARGNEEFAFRVIDKARVPKKSFKPKRVIAIGGAALVGVLLAVFFLLAQDSYRRKGGSFGRDRQLRVF